MPPESSVFLVTQWETQLLPYLPGRKGSQDVQTVEGRTLQEGRLPRSQQQMPLLTACCTPPPPSMLNFCWQVLMESFLSQPHPDEAKGEPGSGMTQEQKEVTLAGSRKWLSDPESVASQG